MSVTLGDVSLVGQVAQSDYSNNLAAGFSLHLSVFAWLHELLFGTTISLSSWVGSSDLSGDLLTVGSCDRENTGGAHLDALVFGCVENLKDILAKLVSWSRLHRSSLEKHLDVSQLSEVEVTLLIKGVILELKLLHGSL